MSDRNVTKIVVDTNIWISFLIGRSFDSLVNEILSKQIEVFFSRELHDELFSVISRPKFESQISKHKIAEIREIISGKITVIKPDCAVSECRDPKDNFILELAASANADYLVTGDEDLLVLNPFRNIKIVNPSEFENILHK